MTPKRIKVKAEWARERVARALGSPLLAAAGFLPRVN
jgi:hypothetical protein